MNRRSFEATTCDFPGCTKVPLVRLSSFAYCQEHRGVAEFHSRRAVARADVIRREREAQTKEFDYVDKQRRSLRKTWSNR
jgi:hypothetical protein